MKDVVTLAVSEVRVAYAQTCDVLLELRQSWDSARHHQVGDWSHQTKQDLIDSLNGLRSIPQQAESLILRVLAGGLLCGALDGAILFQEGSRPPALQATGPLDESLLVLDRNLQRACQVADGNWRHAQADDLHLLAGYGKQQNLATLEETEQLLQTQPTLEEFQVFALATFKAGYAVGLADAAVIFVAGEHPDPVPPAGHRVVED